MGEYAFFDFQPPAEDMAGEVLAGLTSEPKYLPPKYFYDERGSQLFEQITQLDEYYLTRTEMGLFASCLPSVAAELGDQVCLVEYGSGSSLKIRRVLEAITPRAYVPVDISHQHLQDNAQALHADFPDINVFPICADFTQPFNLPDVVDGLVTVGFFPGSSIGNFEPTQAQRLLGYVRDTVGAGGALLIGVDREKPVAVLESAYNDAQGVTAAFNLNILSHLNNVLGTDFLVEQFEHRALYNQSQGCIQMFLDSKVEQHVSVAGREIAFGKGEALHTENSYKYTVEDFCKLAKGAGFRVQQHWSDAQDWFSLFLLRGV